MKILPPKWRPDVPAALPFGIKWLLTQKVVMPTGLKVLKVRPRPDNVDLENDDLNDVWDKAEGCEMHLVFDNNDCIDNLIDHLEDLKMMGPNSADSTKTITRKTIVKNIADLVEHREIDRKKRKLKLGDAATEAIKVIGRRIAKGDL